MKVEMQEAQDYTVRDGERELRFTGVELAAESSAGRGKQRWIEFRLFRTVGGNYVIERIGQSRANGEVPLCFAQMCETARSVLETLYQRDGDGAWFLSNVAKRLLEKASDADDDLAQAYRTEYID